MLLATQFACVSMVLTCRLTSTSGSNLLCDPLPPRKYALVPVGISRC